MRFFSPRFYLFGEPQVGEHISKYHSCFDVALVVPRQAVPSIVGGGDSDEHLKTI
jgi:hypothetical protein